MVIAFIEKVFIPVRVHFGIRVHKVNRRIRKSCHIVHDLALIRDLPLHAFVVDHHGGDRRYNDADCGILTEEGLVVCGGLEIVSGVFFREIGRRIHRVAVEEHAVGQKIRGCVVIVRANAGYSRYRYLAFAL